MNRILIHGLFVLVGTYALCRVRHRCQWPRIRSFCLLCALGSAFAGSAEAIDLQPGELRPLAAGTNVFQLSYAYSLKTDLVRQGEVLPGDPEVEANLIQFRLARYSEASGHPLVLVAQIPLGSIHPGGDLSTQSGDRGVGDATFIFGVWPYANSSTQTFFATGIYLSIPTGHYSAARSFNLGENRTRIAWQLGYQAPVADKLIWMWAVDATYFQDNADYGLASLNLSQAPLYAGQLAFKVQWTAQFALAAGYFYTVGGETRIDGLSQDNALQTQRYQLSGFLAVSPTSLVTLQYGGDLSTENGLREAHRLLIRYTTMF
jgi:hypothetical protein